jgi:anion-transporting  ArsA/GET3 family ATPase
LQSESLRILDRRVHLVTGKGGVGKTTVTAALARAAARHGKRVLALDFGDAEGGESPLGILFGRPRLSETPVQVAANLQLGHLWAPLGHEGFLASVLSGPLARGALRSKALRKFLEAAPSFHEMGIYYHLLMLLEATLSRGGPPRYDVLVLDMPATGHTLALTELPRQLEALMPVGPIAKALARGKAFMNDPDKAAAWVVTLPEQLPVSEALELVDGLRSSQVAAGGILLNRVPADPFTPEGHTELSAWLAEGRHHGAASLRRLEGARESEARLRHEADVPVVALPEVARLDETEAAPGGAIEAVLFAAIQTTTSRRTGAR